MESDELNWKNHSKKKCKISYKTVFHNSLMFSIDKIYFIIYKKEGRQITDNPCFKVLLILSLQLHFKSKK